MNTTPEDIVHRFTNHPPEHKGVSEALDSLTAQFIELGEVLAYLPAGREAALALTKLEECSMWAKAAVARNQDTVTTRG